MELHSGHVAIAQGGQQLRVVRASAGMVRLAVADSPTNLLYKPSVNELFGSLAHVCRSRCLGVVLTGMGDDGRRGVLAVKEAGGSVIAESEETAVIFGMPQQAIRTGVVDAVLPLDGIAGAIQAGIAHGRANPIREGGTE